MTIGFRDYQKKAVSFAIYPATHKVLYPALGLCGETGEVAEKVKKQVRDGVFNRHEVAKELGDVLWYWIQGCIALGYTPEEVMKENIAKLEKRYPNGFEQIRSEVREEGDI